jgi:hypothetical protein
MSDREIVSLVWHRRGLQIEVGYVEGDPEHWIGSDVVAAVLADDAGLRLMPSLDETVRWVRDPDSAATAPRRPYRRYPALD